MITPQEIRQTAFARAFFGGYDMADVDEFFDTVTADYTALYKETNTLKSKMKVLVETIEEYRRQIEALKKELEETKVASSRIVADAQSQCSYIKQTAEAEIAASRNRIQGELDAEQGRLLRSRELTKTYIDHMRQMTMQHMQNLNELAEATEKASRTVQAPVYTPAPKPAEAPARPVQPAEAPARPVQPAQPAAQPVQPVQPAAQPAAQPKPAAAPQTQMPKADPRPVIKPDMEPDKKETVDDATKVMHFNPEDLPPLPGSEEARQSAYSDQIFDEIIKAASAQTPGAPKSSQKFEYVDLQFGKDYDVNQQ